MVGTWAEKRRSFTSISLCVCVCERENAQRKGWRQWRRRRMSFVRRSKNSIANSGRSPSFIQSSTFFSLSLSLCTVSLNCLFCFYRSPNDSETLVDCSVVAPRLSPPDSHVIALLASGLLYLPPFSLVFLLLFFFNSTLNSPRF